MSIIPDPILALLQVLPFLVLMLGLHLILFKPMIDYLQARQHATVGARKEAEALAARAEARLLEYEAALAKARAEVAEFRSEKRGEAAKRYQARLGVARKEADARLAEAMGRIAADATAARDEIGGRARALAADTAAQVLGRPLTVEA